MTESIPSIVVPTFAVFEHRRAKEPIFLASGLDSSGPFRQACAFLQGYNGDRGTGRAVVRRAVAQVIFGRVERVNQTADL